MKKKKFSFIAASAIVLSGATCLASCGGSNKNVVDVYLSYSQEDVSLELKSSDVKTLQYEMTTTYGTTIDLDKFSFMCERGEKGGNWLEVPKKVGEADGYTLDGNLGEQNAGQYTLTFGYEEWSAVVKVQINQKEVALPHFTSDVDTSGEGVVYTGEDYTKKIEYDHDVLEMLEPNVERIEPKEFDPTGNGADRYNVKFALLDKVNYVWPQGSAIDSNNQYTFSFIISKILLEVDASDFTMDTENGHYDAQSNTFNYMQSEITFEGVKALVSLKNQKLINNAEVKVYDGLGNEVNQIEVDPSYGQNLFLRLVVKDTKHYEIKLNTDTGNPMEYIVLVNVHISY